MTVKKTSKSAKKKSVSIGAHIKAGAKKAVDYCVKAKDLATRAVTTKHHKTTRRGK